jgi:hypothetical protein
MIKTIVQSFATTLKERVNSPFIGAAVCSWLFINWEIVLKMISKDVKHDHLVMFISFTSNFKLLVLPLFIGFAYSLLFPWLEREIQGIRNKWIFKGKIDNIDIATKLEEAREKQKQAEVKNKEIELAAENHRLRAEFKDKEKRKG